MRVSSRSCTMLSCTCLFDFLMIGPFSSRLVLKLLMQQTLAQYQRTFRFFIQQCLTSMADRYQPYGAASSNPYQSYPPQHGYHGYQRSGAAPPPPPPPGFHHVPPGPPPPMQHPGGFDQPQHAIKRIPSHFSQTSEFLDSNNGKCGLNLQRHIQSTAWSRKEHLHLSLIHI